MLQPCRVGAIGRVSRLVVQVGEEGTLLAVELEAQRIAPVVGKGEARLGGNQRSTEVIRGHQRSSEVIRDISETINPSGEASQSAVSSAWHVRGRHVETGVREPHGAVDGAPVLVVGGGVLGEADG